MIWKCKILYDSTKFVLSYFCIILKIWNKWWKIRYNRENKRQELRKEKYMKITEIKQGLKVAYPEEICLAER